ncbi:MAG: hypothetical protein IKU11_11415 [Clostridia bacterium]|nr:hypothetical protein [Clostridia bacterium]
MCILASSKAMIQSRFAKSMTKTPVDALVFNGIVFVVTAMFGTPALFRGIDLPTLVAGGIFGLASVCFQLFYVESFITGPVSMTVLVVNSGMMIPILVSHFLYNEALTLNRIIGIIITLFAFYFACGRGQEEKVNGKWLFFLILAFLSNNTATITQKIYTNSFDSANPSAFVPVSYLSALLMTVAVIWFMHLRGIRKSFRFGPQVAGTAGAVGAILGTYQLISLRAVKIIDGTILYPLCNGGTTLISTLASTILFRERLSRRQKISVVLGITAIVLMSI